MKVTGEDFHKLEVKRKERNKIVERVIFLEGKELL